MILSGKCDFYIEDEDGRRKYTFDAKLEGGGICFMTIPGNVTHWIENPYDKPAYNMDIFLPEENGRQRRERAGPLKLAGFGRLERSNTMKEKYKIGNWNEMKFQPGRSGTEKVLIGTELSEFSVMVNVLQPGHEIAPEHSHPD